MAFPIEVSIHSISLFFTHMSARSCLESYLSFPCDLCLSALMPFPLCLRAFVPSWQAKFHHKRILDRKVYRSLSDINVLRLRNAYPIPLTVKPVPSVPGTMASNSSADHRLFEKIAFSNAGLECALRVIISKTAEKTCVLTC